MSATGAKLPYTLPAAPKQAFLEADGPNACNGWAADFWLGPNRQPPSCKEGGSFDSDIVTMLCACFHHDALPLDLIEVVSDLRRRSSRAYHRPEAGKVGLIFIFGPTIHMGDTYRVPLSKQ